MPYKIPPRRSHAQNHTESPSNPALRPLATFSWLPGILHIQRGTRADYNALSRFHYRPSHPATFADIWTLRHLESGDDPQSPNLHRPVAVLVTSWPTLRCFARERALDLASIPQHQRIAWLNQNLRTISRVIVHPQFRGVGLASTLVRHALRTAKTPYLEAIAQMARAHPFFAAAGMTPYPTGDRPNYYLWRNPDQS